MKQHTLFPERDGPHTGLPGADRRSFLVTPWQRDFLTSLLDEALKDCDGDLSRAVFLFPHSRPEKYFTRLLRLDDRVTLPLVLPRFYTVGGLFSDLSRRITGVAAWEAGLLDRVGLLLECVRTETADAGLFQALPGVRPGVRGAAMLDDARQFFPWGVRLAALFEECFTQNRLPQDFQYTEGQVTPFAARLLERLSGIFARYTAGLAAREWTTPGRDAALVADHLAGNGSLPAFLPSQSVLYIAGFHALTGTEDALFRHLWHTHGGRVILHADPAVADGNGHWSCEPLREWARRWQARMEPLTSPEVCVPGEALPRVRYYEGFDLHSQLQALQGELAENGGKIQETGSSAPGPGQDKNTPATETKVPNTDLHRLHHVDGDVFPSTAHEADTAVVLPDTGLLMPVLHHLPRTDINVSMGYPLSRSPLFRLIDTILRLQEGRREHGYYWRDLVELVRHPYLKMLEVPFTGEDSSGPNGKVGTGKNERVREGRRDAADSQEALAASLRRELGRFEQTLRGSGRNYPDPFAVLQDSRLLAGPGEGVPPAVAALTDRMFSVAFSSFEQPTTPRAMGKALEGLCALLLAHGRPLWDRFLIDAECLYRLMQSVIPELTHSALAEEEFTPSTLFALVRQLLDAERVPFEATPLVGLQVMGVLETRLLTFRRVFLVDATEDHLPGSPIGDPLLPETLRREMGLPGAHSREQVAAYHFFRLLAGAEEVVLLWQEAPDAPGVQDGKKKKSRFVEELLWSEEKRLGRLLSGQGTDGPLEVLSASITLLPGSEAAVPVTPAIRKLVDGLLERPVSASLLDAYMRCPLRFFHERVLRLAPAEEITEGEDPLAVGRLLHSALQEFYAPRLNTPLPAGEELTTDQQTRDHQELMAAFTAQPEYAALRRTLAADSFTMLETAARERLLRYLQNQPATRVLALETTLQATFAVPGRDVLLTGTADRVDLRIGNTHTGGSGPLAPPTGAPTDASTSAFAAQGGKNIAPDALPGMNTGLILYILDYKTGVPSAPAFSLWNKAELWQRMDVWQPGSGSGDTLLTEVAAQLGSVQLPLYLLLFSLAHTQARLPQELAAMQTHMVSGIGLDAAWVTLGGEGLETSMFQAKLEADARAYIVQERVPGLIRFLIRHLSEATHFFPHPGPHCLWCSCGKTCSVRAAL